MKRATISLNSIMRKAKSWEHNSQQSRLLKKKSDEKEGNAYTALKVACLKIEVVLLKYSGPELKRFITKEGKPTSLETHFKNNMEYLSYIIFWTLVGKPSEQTYFFMRLLLEESHYRKMKQDIQDMCALFKIKHRYYKKSGMNGYGCVKFYLKKK